MPDPFTPEVLNLVRTAKADGLFYDDDVVAFVARESGREADRELGRECYKAKTYLRDEEAQVKRDALLAEGYAPLRDIAVTDGARFVVRFDTTYVGREVAEYSEPREVRARVLDGGRVVLLPKGSRTRGFAASGSMLVRPA